MSVLRLAKQERFCQEFVKDFNGKAAALRAGYRPGHIYEAVSRLTKDARVRLRIAELREAQVRQARAETEIRSHAESNYVLAQLVKIARADPRKYFHADGTPKKVHELGDEEAAALSGFEPTGEAGKVVDRLKVLELLGRHFGLWQQKPAPAHDTNLFEGMSLDDIRRVRDTVGKILTEGGRDLQQLGQTRRRE